MSDTSPLAHLPTEVVGCIMRFVSHPCADLIRQIGLVHEYPAGCCDGFAKKSEPCVRYFTNGVFTDGHNDVSGWNWAHRYARLVRYRTPPDALGLDREDRRSVRCDYVRWKIQEAVMSVHHAHQKTWPESLRDRTAVQVRPPRAWHLDKTFGDVITSIARLT